MGWILIGIFIGVPAFIFGGSALSVYFDTLKEKQEQIIRDKKSYDKFLQNTFTIDDNNEHKKFNIKDMPQVSFERFLNLYNSCPEKWVIERNQYQDWTVIPYYKTVEIHENSKGKIIKNTVYIPIFWASYEDMKKYDTWADTDYLGGNTRGYENKRDEQLSKLANYLQQDIQNRRARLLKEYEQVVDKSAQVQVADTNIVLDLNNYKSESTKNEEFIAATMGQ